MREESDRPLRVMPWWVVVLGLVGAIGAGVAVIWWLLAEAGSGNITRASLRIDAIRTGLTVVAGTGGAVALVFAARRQWLAERAQRHSEQVDAADRAHADRVQDHQEKLAATERQHQDQVAEATERDATERRITDLFAKAVDQLGADTAAARLGGLYALERLAQTYAAHRQTIVDMICGYLRMPANGSDPQEPQVRQTAQRILCRHLRHDPERYWDGVTIDLSGAVLTDFDASGCRFGWADFAGTRFEKLTLFEGTVFDGHLMLRDARFTGVTSFVCAAFPVGPQLDRIVFEDVVHFSEAMFAAPLTGLTERSFGGAAFFHRTRFLDTATFDHVRFPAEADFGAAEFAKGGSFEHAEFGAGVNFQNCRFGGPAFLRYLTVRGDAVFTGAAFGDSVNVSRTDFHDGVRFDRATFNAAAWFEHTRASTDGSRIWPEGLVESVPADGWVTVSPRDPDTYGRLPKLSAGTTRSG